MNILVIYFRSKTDEDRNTINEHLYAFRRYSNLAEFYYFNAVNGIPWYLTFSKYDGVILHYTFLAVRMDRDFFKRWEKTIQRLKDIKGYKVAIPQDEYVETDVLCNLFKEKGVKSVFTCFFEKDYNKAYPQDKVPLDHIITVYPGYIDEDAVKKLETFCVEGKERPIILGYRARKLPYWLGRHGQLKHELGKPFSDKMKSSGLKVDISTSEKDVFLGYDWYRFLCRCRAVLGCEGGASLMDPTGNIRIQVDEYVKNHPDASFEEVERNCFFGQDNNICLFTLSPRHFECAITRTCQILLEGEYGGIFKPGEHYIELKKDYSNIDKVIELLHDKEYCAQIAENTYRDIVQSEEYTYREFANRVIAHIAEKADKKTKQTNWDQKVFSIVGMYLSLREHFEPILIRLLSPWLIIKLYRGEIIKRLWLKIKRGWEKHVYE